MAAKIRKGDRVVVTTGKDKGKKGEVLRVYPDDSRVLVAGINLMKKHQKQSQKEQGGIITKEAPIHVSNVAHIDPKSGNPTRVGFKTLTDGRKVRVATKSGESIDV
jgi:large subunit ribosomal protein L24